MKKNRLIRDFDYYIDEYMYNCRSRKLRPKTMQSYEQTLRLFERWCLEEAGITEPGQVLDSTIRHYICNLQDRGKYTFYAVENCAITYNPARRRDFSQTVSTTTINNYIRNLKYTACQLHHAIELLDSGKSYNQVEAMTGISKSTLIRAKREA